MFCSVVWAQNMSVLDFFLSIVQDEGLLNMASIVDISNAI